MKEKKIAPRAGIVPWPKLMSGEMLEIRDANDAKIRISFTLARDYFGNNETEQTERRYYWFMRMTNGLIVGCFTLAKTEYLRKTDMELMLSGLLLNGEEDFYLVKKRRSFKIDLPTISNEEDDNY